MHVVILPALIVSMLELHLWLIQKSGMAAQTSPHGRPGRLSLISLCSHCGC
ncbi:MAG: cytochrome b [Acidobacteriia bacterium]|nr:cytochrome b [Terriglobia bacterium]